MAEGSAGRSIKIISAALLKKLSGELSGGKGRRHWRRRSRMLNLLKPLIGKEGEKEIKSMKKKKRKWRRWRGERGCDHGRLEAASENDGAGTGRILGASGGHGRQGAGEMGEEEIGQNGGLSRERESKVVKVLEDGGLEDGGRRRGGEGRRGLGGGFLLLFEGRAEAEELG